MRTLLAVALTLLAGALMLGPVRAAQNAFGTPIAVVYPLTLSGAPPNNEVGPDVAILLATRLSEGGKITVRPYTPGTVRAQFLDAAIKIGADYYVTGYLQPLGSDISMLLQVVSTHSGSVVFSTTTEIRTFADAAAQADPVREAILRHAGRGLAALDAPPPAPEPSATSAGGQGVNLSKALRHHDRATPAPAASPTSDAGLVPIANILGTATAAPTAAAIARANGAPAAKAASAPSAVPVRPSASPHPSATTRPMWLVLIVAGGEAPDLRVYAADSIARAVRTRGQNAAELGVQSDDARKNAESICAANAGSRGFLAPTLTLGKGDGGQSRAQLSIAEIDCTGAVTRTIDVSADARRGGERSVIDGAANKIAQLIAQPG